MSAIRPPRTGRVARVVAATLALRDEARILNAAATYDKTHKATALISALNREVRDLHALKTKLAKQTASAANGGKGKADVAIGLEDIAGGYRTLAKQAKAASTKKPVSKAVVAAAKRADIRGHDLVVKGIRLLAK